MEKPFPDNLYTVNSCAKCNQSFSIDEEYFLNILVEISLNPVLLIKKESGNVYRARQRSSKLRERITNSFVDGKDGRRYIQPEYERINKVIEKNALGLYMKKYNFRMPLREFKCTGIFPYNIDEMRPADVFMLTYRGNFLPKKWTVIQPDVFAFIVVRDWRRGNKLTMIFIIHNTVWCTINVPYPHYRKRKGNSNWDQLTLFDSVE
ncbi:hypothetical protein [Mucilaginibacter sp. NFX135]|uniref:hypothetical protein n=1 Tax=Mucilaginibacter sp. NFX135 TaxID=3402687 RepID=UPI003AFB1420